MADSEGTRQDGAGTEAESRSGAEIGPREATSSVAEESSGLRVTYIGHATLLLEMAGVRILTDPNFEPRLGFVLRRVASPGIALDELPRLDAILLTHAHADHLSFRCLRRLPRDIPLYAPPAVERWLRRLGYGHALPLPPGGSVRVGELEIAAAAARHLGSRYAIDRWRAASNMYLLDSGAASCFFAGDTALTEDSKRIVAERIDGRGRTLDVALLPIGHAPWWKPGFRRGHLTADDALTLYERLRARFFIPYHWGTFHHMTTGPYDAIRRLRARLVEHERSEGVRILEPGMSFELDAPS